MTTESRALRALPLALSLATFLAIGYLACLALALIVPDRGLHGPWLQFYAGFSWTWQGIVIGLVESLIYGFVAGVVFAPIYNFFNDR
ncbi:MAG: hypothetical protein HY543_12865 [Deltaproteobacteria bacterium]|nr:hypothetical protein [Deltaproteobacteria bacterium]